MYQTSVVNVIFLSTILGLVGSLEVTCHGESSSPLTEFLCEDSDFLVTTTCVTVVLAGKLFVLDVDGFRDEDFELVYDDSCNN